MTNTARYGVVALLIAGSTLATAQDDASPAAPPKAAAGEERKIEIIEASEAAPAPGDHVEREVHVLKGPDGEAFLIDVTGETHELGDAMGLALEFNPDLRAIRAEIQALLARLEQLEMKTATDVARKRGEIGQLLQKREKDKQLVEKNFKMPEELIPLDIEIEAKKIELMYLTGDKSRRLQDAPQAEQYGNYLRLLKTMEGDETIGPLFAAHANSFMNEPRPTIKEGTPEQLREILSNPIVLQFKECPLNDVVKFIVEFYEVNFNVDPAVREMPIDLNVKNVSMQQALSAIADAYEELAFVIRDYGIFVTTRDRALTVPGPSIPEGVPYRKGGPRRLSMDRSEQSGRVLDYIEVKKAAPAPEAPKADGPKKASP